MSFCYTVYSSYPLLKHNIFNNNSSEIGIGSIILCLLYLCSATFTIFSIRKQRRKVISNQNYEGMALHVVFPVYLPIMWISAITDLFVVIAIVFVKFHNDSDDTKNLLVASICAMAFGFQHMVLEGLAFLLMQYGCGIRAIQISTMVGILAGIYTFLSILFYYNNHVALLYFGWSISLLILYLVLYLTPMKWLFRRPAIIFYSKFWSLFYVLQSLALGLLILGDYLSTTTTSSSNNNNNNESGEYTNMTGMCLYHLGAIPLFVICKPFILYQTLLIESTWWQGLSLYKINSVNNNTSIHRQTSNSLPSNSYTTTNKEERDVESIEQQQECDDTEEIDPLILVVDKKSVVRSPIPGHHRPSSMIDSWFKSVINYFTNNNIVTKNHHQYQKNKQYHSLNNHQQHCCSELDRQVSSDGSSNNFEELKGPLLGVEVGFSEAQQLAQEVDKINSLGMVKLLNFAYLSLNKKGSNIIGAGSFSKVYSGKYRNHPVAIKMLFTQDLNPEVIKRCSNEARILAELAPNSHVVKIFGVAVLPPSVCIVLEICEFGSLADVLRGRNAGYGGLFGNSTPTTLPLNLTYTDKMYLALGCARGLQALHSYSSTLCHRDIKSFNFLIDSQLNAKIADLDLGHEYNNNNIQKTTTNSTTSTTITNSVSKQLKGNERSTNDCSKTSLLVSENADAVDTMTSPISKVGGSNMCIFWQSPEVLLGQQYTQRSDIYSLALVIWEILSASKVVKFTSSQTNNNHTTSISISTTSNHRFNDINSNSNISYGCVPYAECKNQNIVREKVVRGIRPMIPPTTFCSGTNNPSFGGVSRSTDPLLIELLHKSWHSEPRARPDIDSIVEGLSRCWRNSLHSIISETEHLVDIKKIANENIKLTVNRDEGMSSSNFWGKGMGMRSSNIMLWNNNTNNNATTSDTTTTISDHNTIKYNHNYSNNNHTNTYLHIHNVHHNHHQHRIVRKLPSPEVIASLLLMKSESKWSSLEVEGAFLVLTPLHPFYMLWATKKWTELTGYLINDIIAYQVCSLLGPKINHSTFQELLIDVSSKGVTNHTVATIYRRDGKPLNLSIHMFPVFDNSQQQLINHRMHYPDSGNNSLDCDGVHHLSYNTCHSNSTTNSATTSTNAMIHKALVRLSFSKCSINTIDKTLVSSNKPSLIYPNNINNNTNTTTSTTNNIYINNNNNTTTIDVDNNNNNCSLTWKDVKTPIRKVLSSKELICPTETADSTSGSMNANNINRSSSFSNINNCHINDITKLTRHSFCGEEVTSNFGDASIVSDDYSVLHEYSNISVDMVFDSLIEEEAKQRKLAYIVIQFSLLTEN